MEVQMQHKLFKVGQETINLESSAQTLEARLMILEAAAGNDPQAEVSKILRATEPLPGYTDVAGRVPVLAKKSQALESLVQKLAARVSFLEATSAAPLIADEASQGSPGKVMSLIPEEMPAESHQTMKKKNALQTLSESSQRISAYEGLAEKLESRLMLLEEGFGKAPTAEIPQVLGSSPELPSTVDMEARIPALIHKSAAFKDVVSNLDARIEFLESHSQEKLLSDGFEGKISSSTKKTVTFEALAEKMEARLMLLEAASGKTPESEVSKLLGTTAPLQGIVSDEAKVPVLAQKGVALQSLVEKMTARIAALEARSPPSLSAIDDPLKNSVKQAPVEVKKESRRTSVRVCMKDSRVEGEVATASTGASALESLAEKYEARILLLEEAYGNIPQPFVSQVLSTTTALPATASVEVKVPLLNQKSAALESLTKKMAARIAYLEAESPRLVSSAGNAIQTMAQQAQTTNVSQETFIFRSLGEKPAAVSQPISTSAALTARMEALLKAPVASNAPQVPEVNIDEVIQKERYQAEISMSQLKEAHALEVLQLREELMKASSIAVQERRLNDEAVKCLEQQLQQERLLQEQASKELQIMKGESNKELETMKVAMLERSSNDEAIKGLELQLQQERLLQEQANQELQIMKGEVNRGLETIKGLELQLKQERDRAILQEQANKESIKGEVLREANKELEVINSLELQLKQESNRAILLEQANKELEAKLAAALAERQQQSTVNAMLHEQTLKELEAKLLAAAAERQQQSTERVLLHEQTIKELEAKLAAAAEERQQLTTSGEGFQVEVLAQKQRVLEYEERVRELTNDSMRLQEVLQEQQEKISLQTSQFDGERKQLLEQADEFKSIITKLEEAQRSLTAPVSIEEVASPPAPVPIGEALTPTLTPTASRSPKLGPPRRAPTVNTGATSPVVKTMSERSLPFGSPVKAPALVYSGTPLATRVSPPQSVTPIRSTRSMSPPVVQVMSPYASSPSRTANSSSSTTIYPVRGYRYGASGSLGVPAAVTPPAPIRYSLGSSAAAPASATPVVAAPVMSGSLSASVVPPAVRSGSLTPAVRSGSLTPAVAAPAVVETATSVTVVETATAVAAQTAPAVAAPAVANGSLTPGVASGSLTPSASARPIPVGATMSQASHATVYKVAPYAM